jgi:hypothetical protein
MRRLIPVLLAVLLAPLLACEPDDRPRTAVLHAHIRSAVERGPGTVLALDSIAPGEWKRVYVFGPYTPFPLIAACLQASPSERLTHGIEKRDAINLLIFEFEDGSLQSIAVPRRGADFGPEAITAAYTRADARFITRNPPSNSWGQLAPEKEPTIRCGAVTEVRDP